MAITCNNCGYAYNDDSACQCEICSRPIRLAANIALPEARPTTGDAISFPPSITQSSRDQDNYQQAQEVDPLFSRGYVQTSQNALEGRISHLERYDEKPGADFYNLTSKILFGILVAIPYVAVFIFSGALSFAFGILGFSSVSRLFNPITWTGAFFELLEIMVLRRIKKTDTVPFYRGVIEGPGNRQYTFKMQGPLKFGNLVLGHSVRLSGEMNKGTFMIRQGMDLTTHTTICSSYRNPWKIFFFIMLGIDILVFLIIYTYVGEISWQRALKIISSQN